MCWYLILVLLLTVRSRASEEQKLKSLHWPDGCDTYKITKGTGIWVTEADIHSLVVEADMSGVIYSNMSHCQSMCSQRTECGGFMIDTSRTRYHTVPVCRIYNMNDEVIGDHLSDAWYRHGKNYTWYSKTCPYDVGDTDVNCNDFTRQYQDQYILGNEEWYIVAGGAESTDRDAFTKQCQKYCLLHTECRSIIVVPLVEGGEKRSLHFWCALSNTTIPEVIRTGHEGVVRTKPNIGITTYDRSCYCWDGPYIPHPRITTTTAA